jgi:predicted ribonuclease YlaK
MTNPRSITVTTTNFSKWTVSDENNPLPVDLLSLQAKYIRTFAELTWTTASERDNAGFQIQRSTDGIDFENIGNVDVTLQPKLINTYTFKDYDVTKDSYYRLRQIDTDGKFSDSKLVFVAVNNENELTLGISPNPTESEVSLELPNSSDIQIHLLSVTGQTLLEVSGRVQDTVNKLNKKLKTLSIGVYVIHVRQENKMYKGRLIKW